MSEKSTKSIEPTESAKSTQTNESAESTESAESAESTQANESVELTKPAESTKSIEPTESTESAESAESTQANESVELTKPAESTKSIEPTESAESAKSTQANESTESTKSAESTQANESAESTKSAKSTQTNESVELTKPAESTKSIKPTESTESAKTIKKIKSIPASRPPSREAVKGSPAAQKRGSKKKSQAKIYVGRRKTSVARIRLVSGSGEFHINRRSLENYFPVLHLQQKAKTPLLLLKQEKKYDTLVNVKGGGFRGQAEAISLGIARALSENDPASQKELRSQGLLTRDPRMVERKKYGLHKARRAPQFSKR